ncbi:hypothetical protein Tco_0008111 [Tanacetum coccineum]
MVSFYSSDIVSFLINISLFLKSQSDSSHASVPVGGMDTADFPSNNSGNDAVSHPVSSGNTEMRHNDSHCTRYKIIPSEDYKRLIYKGFMFQS